MSALRGDDYEDDYVPDDLVAESGGEEAAASLSEDEEEPKGHTTEGSGVLQAPAEDTAKAKKRKRREKEKEKKIKKRRLVEGIDANEPISVAARPPALLAEYLSEKQAKSFSKLSAIELEDIRIPESVIADTTVWTAPRTLDQLGDFIAKAVPALKTRLAQKSKDSGAPTLLFIAAGALRVADVTRVLKSKTIRGEKGGDVAKLFARHFKLEEHVAYLKRSKIGAAVGTPGRIGKLLCESDAVSLSALTHIMLDVTFRDVKKRSILDIPETRDEVFRTVLGAESVRQGIQRGKIQVVLF
ncbi:U3-containing 90S pre-ribosomal complex subunit-domain containing protein [Phellopilus nigrolimitatus]|nr:U3-containing 90S pre-ribosomal complex subunit-domain containing protein [Phellopilus nigrolimitatus]